MTSDEFKKQMDRIRNEFGSENYSGEKLELIWKYSKALSVREFSSIVESMIGSFRKNNPPLPINFRDAASPEVFKRTPDAMRTQQILEGATKWENIPSEMKAEWKAAINKIKSKVIEE